MRFGRGEKKVLGSPNLQEQLGVQFSEIHLQKKKKTLSDWFAAPATLGL